MSGACGLLEGLHARAYDRCIPLNVSLELTLRCNIRCTHCYNFDRDRPLSRAGVELSMEEIGRLFDDLRRAGTLFLALTGGEAMAHPRFWEVADLAAARGFAVTLLSNGTLLTEAACDRLAGYANLWGVSLSVYGAVAATHDGVTQGSGSFERTMAGARRLRDRGVRVGLKYVVLKANAGEVGAMVAACEGEGFEVSVDPTITGRYDGTSGSLGTRVDPATLEALYRGPLRERVGVGKADPTDDEFKCNCARGNAAVMSSGDVYPCVATPLKAGNIREGGFLKVWKESPVFQWIRGLKLSDFKTCAPCPLKAWCRRSPGPATILHGDFTGVDPWICKEAEVIKGIVG